MSVSRSSRFPAVLACVLASLLLGACATGPTYREPEPAAPRSWQALQPHDGSLGSMRDWWRQFDDPTVARLISIAESDSPTLTKAWTRIEKARATLTTERSAGLPSVDGNASMSRARAQSLQGGAATTTTRSDGLDAAWEIDLFAKVRRSTEAASARVEARVADWHDARVSLAAEVADTYVQYRACGLLAETYEREQRSTAATEKATSAAVSAGFNPPSDAALARASQASATSTLLSQREQCELLVKSLVALTGLEEPALRSLMGNGSRLPEPSGLEVPSVPANALRQRPDLASLERELAASSAEIGVAQADLYPSLSLSGSISVSATSGVSSFTAWSFGPALSIPLFDAGRRHAAVDSAQAGYQSALADYRQGVRNAVMEVEQALVKLDSIAHRTEQAEHATEDYRNYFRATEANWQAGGESLITLEEARRLALSAEINLITLQRDRVEQWIALYKALGGSWQPGTPADSPDTLAEAPRTQQ
jgi:NodT family efflux transporter outer membrane factor (OMF) lipoprotein